MFKNIILDVGGIIFDDSQKNIEKLLNKNCDYIYKKAYGSGFKECVLGKKTVQEHIDTLINLEDYESMNYILKKENLVKSYPLMKENYKYIQSLKQEGYKLYLLTNIKEDSYNYINDLINIDTAFDGGIYSYQVHLIKPDPDIYKLLINKYNLNKSETSFFDDKEKNIIAANNVGIKAFVFNSINDIKNNLK